MHVSNKEIDTCLARLTWDFQPFLAVTRASGEPHTSQASRLRSECAIYVEVLLSLLSGDCVGCGHAGWAAFMAGNGGKAAAGGQRL